MGKPVFRTRFEQARAERLMRLKPKPLIAERDGVEFRRHVVTAGIYTIEVYIADGDHAPAWRIVRPVKDESFILAADLAESIRIVTGSEPDLEAMHEEERRRSADHAS